MTDFNPKEDNLSGFWHLLKPRVMGLVIFTSICGYILSPNQVHPFLALIGILAIALGAGASGCLNQWYEIQTDRLMHRTRLRPLCIGIINEKTALSYGLMLSGLSVTLLYLAFGLLPSALLLFTIFFYAYVYTVLLKTNTTQNIVIGGASGALPPVIGYSLGGTVDAYAILLFMIIFFWTPAHFWALNLDIKEDYTRSGIPMMPNVHGILHTKRLMVFYAILTTLSTFILLFLRESSILLWILILFLNIYWLYLVFGLLIANKNNHRSVFGYSIVYLFFIFLLFTLFHSF